MPPLAPQWRSLDELEDSEAFAARAAQEFPMLMEALRSPRHRRHVLKIMSAALAAAGVGGCDWGAPAGQLVPAVKAPPGIIPGLPNFYATAHVRDGYGVGVVVKHHMGRPIKVEGNPQHPASLGATDVFAQAETLAFYNPERGWALQNNGAPTTRQALERALAAQRQRLAATRGRGFRILMGASSSPTLAAQLDALMAQYPEARLVQWSPISRVSATQGATRAYGRPLELKLKLDQADVILAIDSDLLTSAPGHLRYARDFAARRNPVRAQKMNRLYAIEPTPTLTGVVADHRFIAGPRELSQLVIALGAGLLHGASSAAPDWMAPLIADLEANRARALIHVGPDQPPETHTLVHAMNETLGARDHTLDLIEPVLLTENEHAQTLSQLVDDMNAGVVDTLLIIDSNPVYAAPGSLEFSAALKRVDFTLTLTPTPNETSDVALWAAPMSHAWEDWSDARAYDGVATILQPQALPLYESFSAHTLLALFAGAQAPSSFDLVQATWKARMQSDFAPRWRDALASGIVSNSAAAPANARLRQEAAQLTPPALADQPLTILFRPDPHVWDGRYADNAWLQELPRPLTKLTWDNPLLISPALARRLNLQNRDMARLSIGDARIATPVWIMPGQAPDCMVASLGFGRKRAGAVGTGAGLDFYPLKGRGTAPTLEKIEGCAELASTEHHALIFSDTLDYVRRGTLADYLVNPGFLPSSKAQAQLYRWKPEGPAAWGMSIDLNACIGCSACVIACQAENNIPVVGKEQVMLEREMHWLRIDRYYSGTPDAPESSFQPVPCMHCEEAPCETVCPVGATMHDSEGLNVMVYNRCIGTRFCSNNCPYKVRRFNYFAFAEEERRAPQSRNPDVTVRARGVMEKCTFCLQRIAEARIIADRDNKPVGDVVTACQAACPTRAITFGDMSNPEQEIAKRKQSPLDYSLLEEQNTRPRVTYEALIRNPNPAIRSAAG